MRGLPILLSPMLFCVVTACVKMNPLGSSGCEHFGFSIQVAFLEVGDCDLRISFLLNHKKKFYFFPSLLFMSKDGVKDMNNSDGKISLKRQKSPETTTETQDMVKFY